MYEITIFNGLGGDWDGVVLDWDWDGVVLGLGMEWSWDWDGVVLGLEGVVLGFGWRGLKHGVASWKFPCYKK